MRLPLRDLRSSPSPSKLSLSLRLALLLGLALLVGSIVCAWPASSEPPRSCSLPAPGLGAAGAVGAGAGGGGCGGGRRGRRAQGWRGPGIGASGGPRRRPARSCRTVVASGTAGPPGSWTHHSAPGPAGEGVPIVNEVSGRRSEQRHARDEVGQPVLHPLDQFPPSRSSQVEHLRRGQAIRRFTRVVRRIVQAIHRSTTLLAERNGPVSRS